MSDEKLKISEAELPELVKSGQVQLPPGKPINVKNPDGEIVSIDSGQLGDALSQGYTYVTQFENAVLEKAREGSPVARGLGLAAEQFADEFLLGLPEVALEAASNPFEIAVREQLKKDHELANTIGGLAGFGTSLFTGVGAVGQAARLGSKAGAKAGAVVANSLSKVGVKRGAKSLAADIVARSATNAARLGVEGAVSTAPAALGKLAIDSVDAVTEDRLPDIEAAAESLMIGGGIGLALGVVGGPLGKLVDSGKKAVAAAQKEAADAMAGGITTGVDDAITKTTTVNPELKNLPPTGDDTLDLFQAGEAAGLEKGLLATLKDEVTRTKPNAEKIVEAGKRLGLDVLPEQVSASIPVQRWASTVAKSPTLVGIARANKIAQYFDNYRARITSIIQAPTDELSLAQAGAKVKAEVLQQAQESIDATSKLFQGLREDYTLLKIPKKKIDDFVKFAEGFAKSEVDQPAITLANNVVNLVKSGRIQDLNKLMELRTNLYGATNFVEPSKNRLITKITSFINDLEEKVIDDHILTKIKRAKPGTEAYQEASKIGKLYDEMQKARGKWKELAENLEESADELKLGNIKHPKDFVRKLSDMTDEEFARRGFPKNDAARLKSFASRYPQQAKILADLNKSQLISKSMENRLLSPRKFLTEWQKLTPEVREVLADDAGRKTIDDIAEHLYALPGDANPSGTASAVAWAGSLSGLVTDPISNLAAAFGSQAVRKAVNIEGVLKAEEKLGFVGRTIAKSVDMGLGLVGFAKNVSDRLPGKDKLTYGAFAQALNQSLPSNNKERRDQFDRLAEKLSDAYSNPEARVDTLSNELYALDGIGLSKTGEVLGQKMVQAVSYLYENMPKARPGPQVFGHRKYYPSDAEISAFERRVAVANDPFVAIQALATDSLTKEHVETLGTLYPKIYQAVKDRIFNLATDEETASKIPFGKKLQLSLLMGIDFDQAISPQGLAQLQGSYSPQETMVQMAQDNSGLNTAQLAKINKKEGFETPTQRMLGPRS